MQYEIQNEITDISNLNQPGIAEMANALKIHRKRIGLTQTQVALKLGISQSFLSKLENAKAEPTALQWLRFCDLTQIDPSCVIRAIQQAPARPAILVDSKPMNV